MADVEHELPYWMRDLPEWSDEERQRWEQQQAENQERIDLWVGQQLALHDD